MFDIEKTISNLSNKPFARCDLMFSVNDGCAELNTNLVQHYYMYEKNYEYISAWINRNFNKDFIPLDRDVIRDIVNSNTSKCISEKQRNMIIDGFYNYIVKTKGRRTLITPSPTAVHSIQYGRGQFRVTLATPSEIDKIQSPIVLGKDPVFKVMVDCVKTPLFFTDSRIRRSDDIKFIILRPKIGKLATPSALNWEILVHRMDKGYIVTHVDSNLNPRYAGVL